MLPGEPSTCAACKKPLDRPARYCYHCGIWLIGVSPEGEVPPAPTSAGPAGPCPRCQYLCPYNSNFCASCGYRLNPNPLSEKEAKARKAEARVAASAAKEAAKSPEQRARSRYVANSVAAGIGTVLFLGDLTFPLAVPSSHSYYLLPLAFPLLGGIGISQQRARKARAALRQLRRANSGSAPSQQPAAKS